MGMASISAIPNLSAKFLCRGASLVATLQLSPPGRRLLLRPSLLPAGTGPERVCLVLATQSPVFPMRQWTCGRQGQDGHAATAVLPAPARRSTQPPGTA